MYYCLRMPLTSVTFTQKPAHETTRRTRSELRTVSIVQHSSNSASNVYRPLFVPLTSFLQLGSRWSQLRAWVHRKRPNEAPMGCTQSVPGQEATPESRPTTYPGTVPSTDVKTGRSIKIRDGSGYAQPPDVPCRRNYARNIAK